MIRYSLDDLLAAYTRAAGRPLYGLAAYKVWDEHVLESMCRCFGVSFEGDIAAPLRAALERAAHVPHPLSEFLEATLLIRRFESALDALGARRTALVTLYREHARALAIAQWGELSERTEDELRAAGWDPAQEPKLDDYIDDI